MANNVSRHLKGMCIFNKTYADQYDAINKLVSSCSKSIRIFKKTYTTLDMPFNKKH